MSKPFLQELAEFPILFLFYLNKYTKNTTQQDLNQSLSFKSTIPEAFWKRSDSESDVQILFSPIFLIVN